MLRKDEEGHYCPYDERADWWTFGVVCYEFATGLCPFRTNKAQAFVYNDPNVKNAAVEPSPQGTITDGQGGGGKMKSGRRRSNVGGGGDVEVNRDLGSAVGKAFDSMRNQVAVVTRSKEQINESMDKAILHMTVAYDLKPFKYHPNLDGLCEALIQRNPDER
jgi:serine/threonine protein kinase